jgi:hypothetical protein
MSAYLFPLDQPNAAPARKIETANTTLAKSTCPAALAKSAMMNKRAHSAIVDIQNPQFITDPYEQPSDQGANQAHRIPQQRFQGSSHSDLRTIL